MVGWWDCGVKKKSGGQSTFHLEVRFHVIVIPVRPTAYLVWAAKAKAPRLHDGTTQAAASERGCRRLFFLPHVNLPRASPQPPCLRHMLQLPPLGEAPSNVPACASILANRNAFKLPCREPKLAVRSTHPPSGAIRAGARGNPRAVVTSLLHPRLRSRAGDHYTRRILFPGLGLSSWNIIMP
jgi:hypothetical protein